MSADLDKAIDRAVREMLDVEPAADLRARVIAQLPAAGSRVLVFGVRRFAVLAAAAALLVLGVTLARRSEPPAKPPVVAHGGDQQLPPDARPLAPLESPSPSQPVVSTSKKAARPAALASAASMDATVAASAIDPLESITPIEVAPIGQTSIAPDPIAVRPLTPITEMQIAPLNPPDRRD
jgi:hypothetical protein